MAKRFLSNINVNDQYTLPSADGTSGQIIKTDGAGTLSFIDNAADETRSVIFTVKNKDSISLSKGTVVHASPSANPPSGNVIEIIRADNNDSSKMPAIGVLNETLAVDAEGECVMLGSVSGIATNSFNIGDELYVSDTPGEFTNTKPTGTSNLIQKIGIVIKSHSTNGLIEVFGAGRANDVPNQIDRNVNFTDNSKLTFGDSTTPDLEIYHDGTNSVINNKTGNLQIYNNADDGDIQFISDDGSGGTTTYYYLDGSLGLNRFLKDTLYNDDVVAKFGTGSDLRIQHSSGNNSSYIQNYTGDLIIENLANDKDITFRSDDGLGGVTTYFQLDGSHTQSIAWKDIHFVDNVKAKFGDYATPDLEIYHDGSNSYITDSGTGDLYIQGSDDIYITAANGEKFITCNTDGSVEIRYDNVKKFETTSTGVTVTGRISNLTDPSAAQDAATKAYVDSQVGANNELSEVLANGNTTGGTSIDVSANDDINLSDSSEIHLGDGSDLVIKHNGTNGFINNNTGTLSFYQLQDDGDIKFFCDDGAGATENYLQIDGGEQRIKVFNEMRLNDDVELRLGTGNDLRLFHNGNNSFIDNYGGNLQIRTHNTDEDIILKTDDGSGGTANYIVCDGSTGAVKLFHYGSIKLETTSTGVTVTGNIDGVGNLFLQDYIYHSGDGDTYFGFPTANEFKLVAGGSNIIAADANSAYLYYQGSSKLQTTSSGIDVTGNVSASGGISGTTGYFTDTLYVAEYIQHIGNTGNNIRFTTDAIAISADATFSGNVTIGDNSASEIFLAFNSSSTDFALGANGSNFMIGTSSDLDTGNLITLSGANGRLGIGTTSPEDKLDIVGYLRISDNKTANTNKTNRIRGEHYDITEQPSTFMFMNSFSADTTLHIGGGSSIENAATLLRFFTAANNTTVAGTERMRIDSSGHLLVNKTSSSGDILQVQGNNNVFASRLDGSTTVGQSYGLRVRAGTNSTDTSLLVENTGGTDLFIIKGDGKVGIGTASPDKKLEVSGDIKISGGDYNGLFFENASGTTKTLLYQHANFDALVIKDIVNNADRVTFKNNGSVGIGTTSPGRKLTIGNANGFVNNQISLLDGGGTEQATIAVETTTANDLLVASKANLRFFTGSTIGGTTTLPTNERMRITSAGNVGINCTPSYKLQWSDGTRTGLLDTNIGAVVIGSVSNDALAFYTNLTEKMRIDSSGNVGIGTASPLAKLQVGTEQNSNATGISLAAGASVGNLIARTTTHHNWFPYTDGSNYYSADNHIFRNASHSAEWMRVNSSGNVGIGLTNPTAKLQVVSGDEQLTNFGGSVTDRLAYSRIGSYASTSGTITGAAALELVGKANGSGHGRHAWIGAEGTSSTNFLTKLKFKIRGETNNGYAWAGSSEAPTIMTLQGDGNVGIGTDSPDARFSVVTATANSTASRIGGLEYSGTQRGLTIKTFQSAGGDDCGVEFNAAEGLSGYGSFIFKADTAERMVIDSSGNVGINGASNFGSDNKAIQLINGVYSGAFQIDSIGNVGLAQNAYQDGSWKYYQTNEAAILNLEDGQFKFFNAASGTADTNITFSQRMHIANDGKVGIGLNSSLGYKLNVAGSVYASGDFIVDTFGDTYRIGADTYTTDQVSGVMIRPADNGNPTAGDVLFVVRSGGGSPRLFVEHSGTTGTSNPIFTIGASSTRANGNVVLSSNSSSYFNGGNVGIGTTSPSAKLTIQGTNSANGGIKIQNSGGNPYAIYSDNNDLLFTNGNGSTTALTIAYSGTITGTGTYTAGNSIKIFEAERSGGAVAGDWSYDDATTDMSLGTSTSHSFSLKTGNTRALTINNSQNALFAGNITATKASDTIIESKATTAGAFFKANSNANGYFGLELYQNTNPKWFIGSYTDHASLSATDFAIVSGNKANGSVRLKIDNSGNVNINGGLLGLGNAASTPNIGYGMFHYSGVGLGIYSSASGATQGIGFWLNNGSAYEAGRFLSNGNLGIGTISPVSTHRVTIEADSSNGTSQLYLKRDSTDQGLYIDAGAGSAIYNSHEGTNTIYGRHIWESTKGTNTVERMRIESSGNVGIGTTMDINKLDVAGNINVQGGNGSYLTFNNGDANIVINNNGSGRDLSFKTYDGSANSERMRINKNGHVGIANTNPLFELCIGAADAPNRNMLEIAVNNSDTGTNIIQNYNRATSAYTPLNIAASLMTFGVGAAATERMRITSAGSVGIQTTDPQYDLHVLASIGTRILTLGHGVAHARITTDDASKPLDLQINAQNALRIATNKDIGIGDDTPSYKLDVAGVIRATGDIIAFSDKRVKENIKTIDNSLEKVDQLRGVEFNKKGEDKKSIGVIAQEIEKILPEVVSTDDNGMKSVAYGNITGVLIEAIKELKQEIETLKTQINK